jgi:hypothetical protein
MFSTQREKIKEKYGGVDRAIEQGSAYRVLRSIFPTKDLIPEKNNSGSNSQQVIAKFLHTLICL